MLANFVLSLSAALALVQEPPALVWGQVRSASTGAPLAYAVIEVVVGGRQRLVVETDSAGIYRLRGISPGRRLIRATHLDHAPHEIEVLAAAGQQIYVEFDLEMRPVKLPDVTARVSALQTGLRDTLSAPPPEIGAATVKVLEGTPGVAELGLAEAAREVPGEPVDPSDVLFVRGGASDLKLVLLNGAPVIAPFHIGGLINALDMQLLRSATVYLGGAPARYDGGLSYVMDLETRSGRARTQHVDVGVDLLAARAITEGPITSGMSYIVGGRSVHGLGATPFVADPFPYTYGDALGRIDIDFPGSGTLSITGFWNRERVRLDSAGAFDQVAEWGNNAGSIRYRGQLGGTEALLTAAAGVFQTELPLRGLRPIVTAASSKRLRVGADFASALGPARLIYGASFDRLQFSQTAVSVTDTSENVALQARGVGDVGGMYLDGMVSATSRLRLRAGLRADVFSLRPTPRIAPRLAATFLITDRAALTLAAGRYRQYVRVPEEDPDFIGTGPDEVQQTGPLTVARASHLVLSLDQDLGEGLRLGIDGFFKVFDGLPSEAGETAQASGLDLWVRRNTGTLTGWFGYSLAWVWSDRDVDRFPPTRSLNGRHLVSAGVSGPMIGGGNFDVQVAYGAGLPFTAIPEPEITTPVFGLAFTSVAGAAAAEPIPNTPTEPNQRYLRVNAQLARTWDAEWRGMNFALTPYLRVLNALDRRDAIFYHFDKTGSDPEPRALAALPVLPIVGVEWKF